MESSSHNRQMGYGTNHDARVGAAPGWRSIVLRAIEVWLVLSVIEVIHGVARAVLLEPLVGDFRARQIAVFTGSAIVLAVAFLFRKWIGAVTTRECLVTGAIWILLTISFEIFLGKVILDLTWERIASDYDISRGGLMPLGLLAMFVAPLIVSVVPRKERSADRPTVESPIR